MPPVNFQFEAIVKPGMEGVVHHVMLYSCPERLMETMVGRGYFCHSDLMPEEVRRCMIPIIAWAVGGQVIYMYIVTIEP